MPRSLLSSPHFLIAFSAEFQAAPKRTTDMSAKGDGGSPAVDECADAASVHMSLDLAMGLLDKYN
jgi:hypothetical protein